MEPTDAQLEECVTWKGDPKDPYFNRIEFARTVLARYGSTPADRGFTKPSEEEIEAVESAFDYVFHFAADEKDGHIAQRICDNLQSLEKKLRSMEAA